MRHLAAVVLLFALGCEDGKSPVQPTPPVRSPPSRRRRWCFRCPGRCRIPRRVPSRRRVEVIAGDSQAPSKQPTSNGRFRMPGTFTGTVTVAGVEGRLPPGIVVSSSSAAFCCAFLFTSRGPRSVGRFVPSA